MLKFVCDIGIKILGYKKTNVKTYLIRAVVVLLRVALVEVGHRDSRDSDVSSEWQLGIADRLLQDGLQVLLGSTFDVGKVNNNLLTVERLLVANVFC